MEENDVNRSAIQEQIKLQGEVVRKLKADKAEKDKVSFIFSVYQVDWPSNKPSAVKHVLVRISSAQNCLEYLNLSLK